MARVNSDAFIVNHATGERNLGGHQIALAGIQLQIFLTTDGENRLRVSMRVSASSA